MQVEKSISVDGYIPLGIVGAAPNGAYNTVSSLYVWYVDQSAQKIICGWNTAIGTTAGVTFFVLYIKT